MISRFLARFYSIFLPEFWFLGASACWFVCGYGASGSQPVGGWALMICAGVMAALSVAMLWVRFLIWRHERGWPARRAEIFADLIRDLERLKEKQECES